MGAPVFWIGIAVCAFGFMAAAIAQEGGGKRETVTLKAGDLTCVLGDHHDHGAGKTGYIGIHKLTHTAEDESPFVPQYAGIIIARSQAEARKTSEREGEIIHLSDGKERCRMKFTLVAPHAVDVAVSTPGSGVGAHINSASYMNGPEDPGIYFVDPKGQWQRHYDPVHGNAASVFPEGATLPVLGKVPGAQYKHGTNSFADSVSEWRYDPKLALYYGRFKKMVLVQMFPPECGVVFYMSPSGGAQPSGRRNPAWDWRVQIPRPKGADEKAMLRLRLVYKPFVSQEDVLKEYQRWQKDLR